jgi:hypothetical protein
MSGQPPLCCATDSGRREEVRRQELNGIDYIEVDCDQTELTVYFLGRAPEWIEQRHVRIEGGQRERDIRVVGLRIEPAEDDGLDDAMIVSVDRPGDFSTYRLCILGRNEEERPVRSPPTDFDPRYACIDFSFKASCGSDLDCAEPPACPPPSFAEPEIDYLAKDYSSFRRLMLDRLSLTLPDWRERHAPDMMITLVELLAYVGDHLSYHQDAVAAEAFLETARRRISVSRHARLVDYRLHEGCNARTWIALEVSEPELELAAADLAFVTAWPGRGDAMLKEQDLGRNLPGSCIAFEPLLSGDRSRFTLRAARNEIRFYDWGEEECCLLVGATSATLRDPGVLPPPETGKEEEECYCPGREPPPDVRREVSDGSWHLLKLLPGDVLIFEERLGPRTGKLADADPARRHAVRLTRATPSLDPLTGTLLYEVEWCAEDALPFPFCISSRSDPPDCEPIGDVSIVRGNVVLADAGLGIAENLGRVPGERLVGRCADDCDAAEVIDRPGRYRPRLRRLDLTYASPYAPAIPDNGGCRGAAAAAALDQDPSDCVPALVLSSSIPGGEDVEHSWRAQRDLLGSDSDDRHFVVEMDDDRIAWVRFGDGTNGRAPAVGEDFRAAYRSGSGPSGNVAHDTIGQIVFRNNFPDGVAIRVRNPLPARGGASPEATARAKLRAPFHFHTVLRRAVAPADYAAIVMRDFPALVQRATAHIRSSPAAVEVQVAVDAYGGEQDASLLRLLEQHLERYRRIGHDVRVIPARPVPLLLELTICVRPSYLRGHVKAALQRVLGAGSWAGGRGLFHPDALSFGDRITISRIAAAAHKVEGVASVVVTRLERLREGRNGEVEAGELALGPFEVARLDNDPGLPENGAVKLNLRGGR